MRFKMLAAALILSPVAIPAAAQDISPAMDPVQAGLGEVMNHGVREAYRNGGQRTSRSRTSRSSAAATCANRGRAAANLGANHPKVQRLNALCARAGY
ncbi:hypothetical protein [Sphingomonas sp. Y38-1Y]|uniref:hypothetical protein n=1 Tax=Sphingomonas sp. Y38-1Y TaxID=3078265 RepID=UPI0028EE305C|nr:hypothetical protein [Sphingomonas sp. Y38-1Y]